MARMDVVLGSDDRRRCRRSLRMGLLVGLLSVASVLCVAFSVSARAAPTATGEIAFLSTLGAWPLPENYEAPLVYSASAVAGQPRQRLDAPAQATIAVGDRLLSLSPDRRTLAVVRGSVEYSEVWLVNSDGSGERRLPVAGEVPFFLETDVNFRPPAWSPDGNRLAVSETDGDGCPWRSECYTWAVAIADTNGNEVAMIDDALNAAWSPDGTRLAVERGDFAEPAQVKIAVVPIAGGSARTVSAQVRRHSRQTQLQWPTWSPDGKTLAFMETFGAPDPMSKTWLHLVRAANGQPLYSGPGVLAGWSRDGSKVLVVGGRDGLPVGLVDSDGRGFRQLAARSGGSAAWSRDGKRVIFVGAGKQHPLYSIRSDGRGLHRLVARTGGSFTVAPDRPLIAFNSYPDGNDIAVVSSTGGRARIVSRQPDSWTINPFGWSADGSRVLFSGSSGPMEDAGLWVMRSDGSAPRLLARTVLAPDGASTPWSPDGSRIAYRQATVNPKTGDVIQTGLHLVRRDGSGRRKLASADVRSFSWSPDGARIVFDDAAGIKIVRRDGSGQRLIVKEAGETTLTPKWSPDGAWIAFIDAGRLTVVRPDGTGKRVLVRGADGPLRIQPETGEPSPPAWSPDSKSIAYASEHGISAVSLDGSIRTLTETAFAQPVWSPDGKHIAGVSPHSAGSELYVAGTDGSSAHVLATIAAESPPPWQPAWSPDSRSIIYAAGYPKPDLYTISPDGGQPSRITNFPDWAGYPSWSPRSP